MTPDRAFIERAVAEANPIALRVALFQATGDPEIEAIVTRRITVAGADAVIVPNADDLAQLRRKAVDYLLQNPEEQASELSPDELDALIQMAEARSLTNAELTHRRPLPNFDEFSYQAAWTRDVAIPDGFNVAIIGGGFAGISIAVQLEELGIPWTLFERRHEVGGVWSINRYPDARVDTLSATYQWGFEKKYPWTQHFAAQPEVRGYIEHVARKRGLWDKIRFHHDVTNADWDAATNTWNLSVQVDGERTLEHRASVIVSGSGLFATPKALNVPGAETFPGQILHTTEWTDDVDLTGKRVAVVGNGSTGVQLVSSIADVAEQLYVCQRTPQWITPRENYKVAITPELRWLINTMPYYWNWDKYVASMNVDLHMLLLVDDEWISNGGEVSERNDAMRDALKQYIAQQVQGREDLIEQLIPTYPPITRRPVVDNDWYASLIRPNVELVTGNVEGVDQDGLLVDGGRRLDVDVVITAVGFDTQRYLWPTVYRGRDGITLEEAWRVEGPKAYLGMTVPGFPNLFMLYGPNSQPLNGGTGLIGWFEVWSAYIGQTIVDMVEGGLGSIEVRPEVCENYNRLIDEEAAKLTYMRKDDAFARNYYVNEWGRLQVAVPIPGDRLYALSSRPDLTDYVVTPAAGQRDPVASDHEEEVVGAR